MGATVVIWGAVLFVLAAVVWLVASLAATGAPIGKHAPIPPGRAVRYRVPEGQDPVVVMSSLSSHGYANVLDEHGGNGERIVLVECEDKADREEVRELIATTGTSVDDPAPVRRPVHFLDEREA
jgi:hypothetical protein